LTISRAAAPWDGRQQALDHQNGAAGDVIAAIAASLATQRMTRPPCPDEACVQQRQAVAMMMLGSMMQQ